MDQDLLTKRNEELQNQILELQEENQRLQHLADQGKAYIELVRTEAKEAHIHKLASEGMSDWEARHGEEHLEYCDIIDRTDDVDSLYKAAQSDYRAARTFQKTGDSDTEHPVKRSRFSRAGNDF